MTFCKSSVEIDKKKQEKLNPKQKHKKQLGDFDAD